MTHITLDHVLNLAGQLSPNEQDALVEQLQSARQESTQREWCDLCDQMAGSMDDDPM